MSKNLIKIFKALSDTTRVDILRELLSEKEVACQDLMKKFSLSQPTLSHHFNKLIDAGVLTLRKEGVECFYSVDKKYLKGLGIDILKVINKG